MTDGSPVVAGQVVANDSRAAQVMKRLIVRALNQSGLEQLGFQYAALYEVLTMDVICEGVDAFVERRASGMVACQVSMV